MANTVSRLLSDETLNKVIQIESAGNPNAKAPTSSAAGLGQFIKGTWLATVQKHKPSLFQGRTRDQVAAMRVGTATAELQLEMLARFTEDNAAALGKGFTDGDLYLAHFLGIGDARKLFRADPGAPAASHVTAAAVDANRSILAGKTCGQVRAWAQASMDGRWARAGRPDWVKKFAGAGWSAPLPDVPKSADKPKPPPTTPKQKTTLGALIVSAVAAVVTFIESHPVATFLGIAAVIAAVALWFWWRRIRARNDIPLGEE